MPFDAIKPRILIVEDNSNDEALLMRQLQKAGLADRVQVITDGNHALNYLSTGDHELVALFLDLHLPGVGGLEILQKVRGHDRLKSLPVIVMTSSNHPDELIRCQQLRVNGFVQKPVTYGAFSKAVADTFHSSHVTSGTLPRVRE